MSDFSTDLNYAMKYYSQPLNKYTSNEIQTATNAVIQKMEREKKFVNGSHLITLIKNQIEANRNRFDSELRGGGKSKSRKRRQTRRRRQKKSRRNGKR